MKRRGDELPIPTLHRDIQKQVEQLLPLLMKGHVVPSWGLIRHIRQERFRITDDVGWCRRIEQQLAERLAPFAPGAPRFTAGLHDTLRARPSA